jgi:squalene-associated FAD-dependent desaturase
MSAGSALGEAAFAAAFSASPADTPAGAPTGAPRRAVVVGGGLAGITAALLLAERGWGVTLVEARPRLGGRATSFRRGEMTVDNGQHVFLRCCTAYRGLLSRLGAGPESGLTHLQDRLDIPFRSAADGRTSRIKRNGLPTPLHLAGALGGYALLPLRDRARLGGPAFALRRTDPASRAADEQSYGSFLRRHGQSQAAIDRLWSVLCKATLNIEPDEASLALAAKVFRTGLLETNDGFDLGYANVPLGRIHDELARKALTAAGVTVLESTKAEPLALGGRQPEAAVTDRSGRRTVLPADAVVLAVPHEAAAALLPPSGHATGLAGLGHSPIVNVHLRYDRPVLDMPVLAAVESPAQWIFERTAASGLDGPPGRYLAITVSAADALVDVPTRQLGELFETEVARLLPEARRASLEEFFVTREHRATFRHEPGRAALRPGPGTAVPGVYLAGAWTDTGWPDTMESAVRSGILAARLVVDQMTGEG